MEKILEQKIFEIRTEVDFEQCALEIFRFQYKNIPAYRRFCELLKVGVSSVHNWSDIPFLPIQFFKSHKILAENQQAETIFTSSGTTHSLSSKHYVSNLHLYEKSFLKTFELQYGNPSELTFLALLPSYLERKGSSLIYMVEKLIEKSESAHSGFFLHNHDQLIERLSILEQNGNKTILIGVSYALLDLIEKQSFNLKHTTVMETGGMKGKRKEMVKEELHQLLKLGFGVKNIHSEYGMTELLSQAYSQEKERFHCPPWMKIVTRDPEDAMVHVHGKTGGINVIDLANLYSCAFIATQDLGKIYADGTFEVLGRFDNSDLRGCNLMVL